MGKRGEGWVVGQFVLAALILLAPSDRGASFPLWLRAVGALLVAAGGAVAFGAILRLGSNLTPLPKPVDDGELVMSGAYAVVRHPIYFGVILALIGWAMARASFWGLALALLSFVFFDAKSRREEQWLVAQYPGYTEYQARVRKLIPWLY